MYLKLKYSSTFKNGSKLKVPHKKYSSLNHVSTEKISQTNQKTLKNFKKDMDFYYLNDSINQQIIFWNKKLASSKLQTYLSK